jgi:hypothetical protein
VTTMYMSTYTFSPSLSKIGSFFCFLFPSFLLCFCTDYILLFHTHVYPWTFLCCCCGAVFHNAVAFNGDLSAWQVGKVSTMEYSTYSLPPLSKIGVFFWLLSSFSLFSFWGSTTCNSILYNDVSSFFLTHFYHWNFLCVAVLQCFDLLLSSMVIFPHGKSGK